MQFLSIIVIAVKGVLVVELVMISFTSFIYSSILMQVDAWSAGYDMVPMCTEN